MSPSSRPEAAQFRLLAPSAYWAFRNAGWLSVTLYCLEVVPCLTEVLVCRAFSQK